MNYGDGNGFGDGNGAWWIIIFLIFALGGFGNGGFGRQGGSGAMEGYVLTSDFANLERKLDGINNGICDSTFALNNTINSGFNGVNVAVLQSANATERGFCNLSAQIAECCCGIKSEIAGINYNMAMNTNTLQ